eukprot:4253103-Pyramimonas_sp.AAC.1
MKNDFNGDYEKWPEIGCQKSCASIPLASPMTRQVKGCALIAECPVDAWQAAGRKYVSTRSWRELALRIATNGAEKMQS